MIDETEEQSAYLGDLHAGEPKEGLIQAGDDDRENLACEEYVSPCAEKSFETKTGKVS